MSEYCPVCGKRCGTIYRNDGGWGIPIGCEHCYTPPNVRTCPKCGELCEIIYRSNRYGDIVGCDKCIDELEAAQDADANPGDYGLPEPDEEEEN